MTLQEILDKFCEQNGVPPRQVDEEGICEIHYKDMHIVIREFPDIDVLLFYGVVGHRPAEGLEELGILMLKANHLFEGTRGASLSLDNTSEDICLQMYLALSPLTVELFTTRLEYFCDTFEAWHDIIRDFRPGQTEHDASENDTDTTQSQGGEDFIRV